eukprot:g3206.t1
MQKSNTKLISTLVRCAETRPGANEARCPSLPPSACSLRPGWPNRPPISDKLSVANLLAVSTCGSFVAGSQLGLFLWLRLGYVSPWHVALWLGCVNMAYVAFWLGMCQDGMCCVLRAGSVSTRHVALRLGVNMAKFCQEFNAKTGAYTNGIPLRVFLTARSDGSFFFHTKLPRTSWFIKNAAKIEKGSKMAYYDKVGTIHVKQIYEIAKVKQRDSEVMQNTPLPSICRSIVGQCKSMGITVVNDANRLQ